VEAIAHLSKALQLIETLPNAVEHHDEELAVLLAIGGPLTATKGYPAPEVERTYSRARSLCNQLGRSTELFPVLRGLWNYHQVRGELRRAHDLAELLVTLAEEQEAPLRRAYACRAMGGTLFFLGRLTDATAALSKGSRSTIRSRPWTVIVPTSCSTRSMLASWAGCNWAALCGSLASPTLRWRGSKLASPSGSALRTPTALLSL
jgi:hypothetical protein